MLDHFSILTKGGFVLWQKSYAPLSGAPVDALIKNVLIEERAGTVSYSKDNYALRWTFANEVDLVFVVAYQKILQLAYIDELLETVKRLFLDMYSSVIGDNQGINGNYNEFEPVFSKVLKQLEDKYANRPRAPRKFEETKKFENTLKGSKVAPSNNQLLATASRTVDEDEIAKNIKALKLQSGGKGGPKNRKGGRVSAKTSPAPSPDMNDDNTGKKKKSQKQARVWEGQISRGEMETLDYSKGKIEGDDSLDTEAVAAQFMDHSKLGSKNKDGIYEVQDVLESEDEEEEEENVASSNSGGIFSFLKNITGQRELSADTLDPVLATMKEHLINKNVASEIAEHLCQSVRSSLMGKKLGGFERVSTAVKNSMETALKRILTPKTSLDILRDIEQTRAEGRPYVISFIGVNGVGKSTNLSKVCFWLLQNNCKVLIAACDTFRSGAVEQLRVHARNLRALQTSGSGVVELFERGYGKDSAGIAKDAISYATVNRFDVVLIDTAGRMQDNEPLMRALAKLVSVNNPDKIIFVGEALVGNEAVDQLTKFNQALKDFSGLQNPRHIDGMILTKFDTIDDKVGAALSMTYITGQPIYFVGTGQTYTDLKNLRVSHVVHSLLQN
ncbi:signal recognition particle, alpha subunit, N-terminal-domain-containing protein [Phycomyces nitens]|nr:signal recognition particle, alpha subunit, N-terminal-domain-containing protein [Phycomyces nitens]